MTNKTVFSKEEVQSIKKQWQDDDGAASVADLIQIAGQAALKKTSPVISAEHAFTLIACTAVFAAFTRGLSEKYRFNLNSSSASISFGGTTLPPTSIQEWIDRGMAVLEELKRDQ